MSIKSYAPAEIMTICRRLSTASQRKKDKLSSEWPSVHTLTCTYEKVFFWHVFIVEIIVIPAVPFLHFLRKKKKRVTQYIEKVYFIGNGKLKRTRIASTSDSVERILPTANEGISIQKN